MKNNLDKTIQIKVDAKLKKDLEKIAELDYRTLSDYVRVQLIKLVENFKKGK